MTDTTPNDGSIQEPVLEPTPKPTDSTEQEVDDNEPKPYSSSAEYLRVLVYPDKTLRLRSEELTSENIDDDLTPFVHSMIRTMYEDMGVGLAAPQVGKSLRIIVIDVTQERKSPLVLFNPVIVDRKGREVDEEGCLSVPGISAKVRRSENIVLEYQTATGERTGLEAEGFPARVLQHEIDHLEGVLFVDKLGPSGSLAARKTLRELEAQYNKK